MLPASSLLFAIAFLANTLCGAVPLTPSGGSLAPATTGTMNNSVIAMTATPQDVKCDDPIVRKEWRDLGRDEQKNYIEAVKCFQDLPARDPVIKGAKSRFEEFQAFHIYIADAVHQLGQFLPWHREYLRLYEAALRDECGYEGANPYWDWSRDADSALPMAKSPVFDPVTGFGGDGVPGTYTLPNHTSVDRIFPTAFRGCVMDGPFKDLKLTLGPGHLFTEHCLTRGIDETMKKYLTSAAVANITSSPDFETFRIQTEGEPITPDHRVHDGGHIVVGGDMSNFYSSPGDPLFYLHHAQLDHMWWKWQQLAPGHMWQVSGVSTKAAPVTNISLDYILQMGSLGRSPPIRDIIDIHSTRNCYTYA